MAGYVITKISSKSRPSYWRITWLPGTPPFLTITI